MTLPTMTATRSTNANPIRLIQPGSYMSTGGTAVDVIASIYSYPALQDSKS